MVSPTETTVVIEAIKTIEGTRATEPIEPIEPIEQIEPIEAIWMAGEERKERVVAVPVEVVCEKSTRSPTPTTIPFT